MRFRLGPGKVLCGNKMAIKTRGIRNGGLTEFSPHVRLPPEVMAENANGAGQAEEAYPLEHAQGVHASAAGLSQLGGFAAQPRYSHSHSERAKISRRMIMSLVAADARAIFTRPNPNQGGFMAQHLSAPVERLKPKWDIGGHLGHERAVGLNFNLTKR